MIPPMSGQRQPELLLTKRKAPHEEAESSNKRTKTKVLKGEKKAGGLIINPILPASSTPQTHRRPGKEREVAPTPQDVEMDEDVRRMEEEVERLRARDVKIHSKPADFKTPVIKTPSLKGKHHRRQSSMSLRGKRASNSFEKTGVIPTPHPSVLPSNFHKHIDQELPEAHRLRHLLVWCTARASAPPGRPLSTASGAKNAKLPSLTAEGVNILHDVQREVQRMLMEQEIDISLSSRMGKDSGKRARVKEHEQNVKNRKREDDFMRDIERCKQEDSAWSAEIQSYNAQQASVMESLSRRQRQSGLSTEWESTDELDGLDERGLLGAQLARKCKERASRKRGRSPLGMRMTEVEDKADRVHRAMHISEQFVKQATRYLDKRFEGLGAALEARSQLPTPSNETSALSSLVYNAPVPPGSSGPGAMSDPLSLLRALVHADVDQARREGERSRAL